LDSILGIVSALAVILLGLMLLVVIVLRRRRAIEASGYREDGRASSDLDDLCRRLFECVPAEVNVKQEPDGKSWLIYLDVGASEDSGCVMLVYRAAGLDWPAVAMVRSGRQIPKIFRQFTGGIFTWAEPIKESETEGLHGTGWFGYMEPIVTAPSNLLDALSKAARITNTEGLLGIAYIAPYLAIWTDTDRVGTLLSIGPPVRQVFLNAARTS